MSKRTILVVEDEETIAGAVAARLSSEGFRVEIARDGHSAVEKCELIRPDLVVLDVMLPGLDGLEVCRRIQADRPVPVLMLTARDSETDVIIGLGIGADDYMTKPFSPRELVARVQTLFRRTDRIPAKDAPIRIGELRIDPAGRRVVRGRDEIHLTPIEFDLLYRLAREPDVVYTREQLLSEVWGYRDSSGARTVDSHIGSLRRKLGAELIRTVHGVGYAIERVGR